jgi:hypothetical protein
MFGGARFKHPAHRRPVNWLQFRSEYPVLDKFVDRHPKPLSSNPKVRCKDPDLRIQSSYFCDFSLSSLSEYSASFVQYSAICRRAALSSGSLICRAHAK